MIWESLRKATSKELQAIMDCDETKQITFKAYGLFGDVICQPLIYTKKAYMFVTKDHKKKFWIPKSCVMKDKRCGTYDFTLPQDFTIKYENETK